VTKKEKKSDFSTSVKLGDRIRMRIGIVLMLIRIRIWIGINVRNSDPDLVLMPIHNTGILDPKKDLQMVCGIFKVFFGSQR
jgi:hypothetical protein